MPQPAAKQENAPKGVRWTQRALGPELLGFSSLFSLPAAGTSMPEGGDVSLRWKTITHFVQKYECQSVQWDRTR
jgi:hypothetical protein